MANKLNLVIRRSDAKSFAVRSTNGYSEAEYLLQPDLTNVVNVEQKFWKVDGDSVVEMSQTEKDAVLAQELADLKIERLHEIDVNTSELIGEGFQYDGHNFSLSQEAQLNWNSIFTLMLEGTIPPEADYEISTKDPDNDSYILTPLMRQGFFGLAFTSVSNIIKAGRVIRQQIKHANTIEEVNSIVDNR